MFYFWTSLYAFSSNKCHNFFQHCSKIAIILYLERLISLFFYDTWIEEYSKNKCYYFVFFLLVFWINLYLEMPKNCEIFFERRSQSHSQCSVSGTNTRSERRTQNNKQNNKRSAPKPKCRSRKIASFYQLAPHFFSFCFWGATGHAAVETACRKLCTACKQF